MLVGGAVPFEGLEHGDVFGAGVVRAWAGGVVGGSRGEIGLGR